MRQQRKVFKSGRGCYGSNGHTKSRRRPRGLAGRRNGGRGDGGVPTRVDGVAVGTRDPMDELCYGEFTREVYNAICVRLGDTLHIPEDSVQALFNDMQLFPSKSQVSKMLQCARQCGKRNGTTDYITFGEFCFLVREMQNQNPRAAHQQQNHRPQQPQAHTQLKTNNNASKCTGRCDVFLGGSCNPTTWRTDTAIPELQKHGISFYNPQVKMWAPELVAQEYNAKQAASVLLFVIDSQTRSTVGMIEVAYLVASGRCVVVVAEPYVRGQSIMGEPITDQEYFDLVAGQKTLLDLVKSKGVKIHTNLTTALQCTANILRNTSCNGMSAEEQITHKLRKLREVYDSYGGEMKLYNVLEAYERLTGRSLEIGRLYDHLGPERSGQRATGDPTSRDVDCGAFTDSPVTFERFCALMAEFSTTDVSCDMCTTDVWMTQPFQRRRPTNNNSSCVPPPVSNDQSRPYTSDIFLGGSLSTETRWRDKVALPLIKKHGLKYYNPVIREGDDGTPRTVDCHRQNGGCPVDVLEWKAAMDGSKVVLMVITNDTRSMTSIIMAAYFIGLGRDVVLCVQNLPTEGCVIAGETLTLNAIKDYNRARVYLRDLAARRHVPVFENVSEAVECAIERCKSR